MAYKYADISALSKLVTKVKALVSAVSDSATRAQTAAQTASAEATYYGTSGTAAATSAKDVACAGFTLKTGQKIAIKFSNANTAGAVTLNVNGSGAKNVYWAGSTALADGWTSGETALFVYDGTYFALLKAKVVAQQDVTLGNISGVLSIAKGGTGSTTASGAASALGCAQRAVYNVNIDTSWPSNSSGGFMKTVSLSGILSTDIPVVGIVMSSDVSAATLQGKAFANVNRITTNSNSITLYAFSTAPTTAFTLQLLVIR